MSKQYDDLQAEPQDVRDHPAESKNTMMAGDVVPGPFPTINKSGSYGLDSIATSIGRGSQPDMTNVAGAISPSKGGGGKVVVRPGGRSEIKY